jgi:ABC-type multidrug transport system fused ATPase/permease subunit
MKLYLLKSLWKHINHKRRLQICGLFILMVITSLSEAVSMGAVMPFLSTLIDPEKVFNYKLLQPIIEVLKITKSNDLLFPLTVIFVITVTLSAMLRITFLWLQTRVSYAIGSDLSIDIYKRNLYQPYSTHISRNTSEIIAVILDKANSVVHNTISPILIIANASFMLIVIMAVLVAIKPLIAISVFGGCGAIYTIIILFTKQKLKEFGETMAVGNANVVKAIQEGLGGIRDVLIDGTQSAYCDVYSKADVPLRKAQASVHIIGSIPRFIVELIAMIVMALLAYSLVNNSNSNADEIIPVMGVLALGAQKLLPILQQAYASWTNILSGYASLKDVIIFLEQPIPQVDNILNVKPISFRNNIRLNNLSFRYSPKSDLVINLIDFTISKGACVGFIGLTGSGKSTVLDLIMGLLSPTAGHLSIDGIKITSQNNRQWQAHVAHVPQSIFLADASIAENIAFGVPLAEIDFDRVKEASEKSKIASTIEGWEHAYATKVGERGVRLSGGQRQRIGIARALYKKADVIILDEATSALDSETEASVINAIENLGGEVTIIVVAHRITTLKNCTQIVELTSGKIGRVGTYEEIFNNDA